MVITLDVAHCWLRSATSVCNKAVTRNIFENSMLRGQCYTMVLQGQGLAIFRPRSWPNHLEAKSDIFKAKLSPIHTTTLSKYRNSLQRILWKGN